MRKRRPACGASPALVRGLAGAACCGVVSILGTRVLRVEDPKFLTTGGIYLDDLRDPRLAGAGYVTYVRSVVPHAQIAVDVSAAVEHPDVVAVFVSADLADCPPPPPPVGLIPPALVR